MLIIITLLVILVLNYRFIGNITGLCHDIIGDGYAMGLDKEPVVIGNTCDIH